jgi:hypothetical protein
LDQPHLQHLSDREQLNQHQLVPLDRLDQYHLSDREQLNQHLSDQYHLWHLSDQVLSS